MTISSATGTDVVNFITGEYATIVRQCADAIHGDPAALRQAAANLRDTVRGIRDNEFQLREDVRNLGSWAGPARQAFDASMNTRYGDLDWTTTAATTCADAMDTLATAMNRIHMAQSMSTTRFEWSGRVLSWIGSFPGIDVGRLANAAVRNGEAAVEAGRQHIADLDAKLTEFITAVRTASGVPVGATGATAGDPPGWTQHYTSPNTHPGVVGTRRVGGEDVPRYDMTGHQPPARPAGDLDQWITDAKRVLAANGVDTSTMTDADLRALIRHESGGNPVALNDWDRNARHGIPSKGLMQTIDQTFNDYSVSGHRDVWNPVDNIVAGVRYGIARYGSFDNIPGIRSLHHGGGYVGY